MKKIFSLTILSLLLVLSIGMVSANTLIVGKIYKSDYTTPIPNANITICCDTPCLDTISLADGTYAVVFEADSCNTVDVTSDANNSEIIYITRFIPNEQPKDSPKIRSSGGGSSSRFYLCGNGICDSGETVNTCPKDCSVEEITELNTKTEKETEKEIIIIEEPEEVPTTLSRITGAVTGAIGTAGSIVVIVFIVGMIGTFTFVRIKRMKNK